MASKPVEAQTCNPQSCVDCRLDGYHWFTGLSTWGHGEADCHCALRWGGLLYQPPNPCSSDVCHSGVYRANDGYIYTRNTSAYNNYAYGICRRPA